MNITEEEKKQILSKYDGKTSNELLNHLKRHFPVTEFNFDWMKKPVKQMFVDDRLYTIEHNKKYLVGRIFNEVEEDWIHLGVEILRRTIKKYIDGNLL
jgi:6-pyruvoyl-tetrahydropterin synthase